MPRTIPAALAKPVRQWLRACAGVALPVDVLTRLVQLETGRLWTHAEVQRALLAEVEAGRVVVSPRRVRGYRWAQAVPVGQA